MTDLRKQDASAIKVWGNRLVKGAWKDHEIRTLEQFAHLSDYNLAQKLRRKPSSVHNKRMNLKRDQEQISEPVITKRLRESRKAKQMERLNVERISNGDARSNVSGDLIPLTENDGVQAVMGRDLHKFLEVGAEYRHWFPRMVEYGFFAGQDYTVKNDRVQDSLGREREATNHIISLDMAKEISMIQRTDKGKQARQYFIECERKAKRAPAELTRLELLQIAMESEKERLALEEKVTELEPKAIHYNRFMDAEGTYTWDEVVRIIGVGKNKMLESLRIQKVLMTGGNRQNLPYQSHMHRFEVKEKTWTNPATGFEHISYDVRLKPEHIDFIAKKCEHLLNPPA